MDPIINLDEPIGKTVGRRLRPSPLRVEAGLIESAKAWRRAIGGIGVPKGVYRFRTHEEADQWLTEMRIKSILKRSS